ncbi:MAG: branched-chain amino acid transaminase [Candidatus Gastranaerophilaceae bacterium]
MTEFVYMDGKYVEKEKASLPVMTHAFLYGTSVFEGVRAYYNPEEKQLYAFRVPEHFERLLRSAKIMRMDPKNTVKEFCEITKKLLQKNNYTQDTYLRPTLYKSAQKIGPSLINNPDSFLIFTLPMGEYIDISKGLKVCVSNWRRNSDNAIPPRAKVSGAYANTALIISDARLAGFDDAIALSEDGTVTEGSAMNLFLVMDGKLVTTNTTDNILQGVTRNTIIQLAKEVMGLEVVERVIDRTELYVADEAFYCGTGAQVSPIVSVDNRNLGDGKVGPISLKLQKLYFDVVKGRVPEYRKWCMPIYD